MSKRHYAALVVFSMLCCLKATASTKWNQLQSGTITVLSDSSKSGQDLIDLMLKGRAALATLGLATSAKPIKPITLIATSDGGLLNGAWPVFEGHTLHAAAVTYVGEDKSYIVLDLRERARMTHLLHEYVHSVVQERYIQLPLWIHEGLAEHFSTLHFQNGSFFLGPLEARHRWQQGSCDLDISLSKLANEEYASREFSVRGGGRLYHSAAIVMRYLVEHYGMAEVYKLLEAVSKGESNEDALLGVFKQPVSNIEEEAVQYCKNGNGTHSYADNAFAQESPTSNVIGQFEFESIYGEMLARAAGRQLDAIKLLESHLRLRTQPEDLRSIGIAHAYRKEFDVAYGFLQKASEKLNDDPSTMLFFSLVCMNRPACTKDEYQHKLERLAELRPEIRMQQDWIKRMEARRESEVLEGSEAEPGSEDSPYLAEESSEWKCGKACEDTEDSKPDPVAAAGKQRGSTLLTPAPKKN